MTAQRGIDPQLKVYNDWAVGVVLFAFGAPFEKEVERVSKDLPVFNAPSLDHVHPWQCRMDKKGMLSTSYGNGLVLASTGKGPTIEDAKREAYNPMNQIRLHNGGYRFDISDKINEHDLKKYKVFGEKETVDA